MGSSDSVELSLDEEVGWVDVEVEVEAEAGDFIQGEAEGEGEEEGEEDGLGEVTFHPHSFGTKKLFNSIFERGAFPRSAREVVFFFSLLRILGFLVRDVGSSYGSDVEEEEEEEGVVEGSMNANDLETSPRAWRSSMTTLYHLNTNSRRDV